MRPAEYIAGLPETRPAKPVLASTPLAAVILLALVVTAVGRSADAVAPETLTEVWAPVPPVVRAPAGAPPSDAIVLFDGKNLDAWQPTGTRGKPWTIEDGALVVPSGRPGDLLTRQSFGDVQLHIEWRTPADAKGDGQNRGNSGVFFMGLYELQVLDSYRNDTYVNGQAGAVYKEHPPLVNASRAPGEWQTYDAVFLAPQFSDDGKCLRPARLTAFHNGVLVQHDVELTGPTPNGATFHQPTLPVYAPHPAKLPLMLQDHGCPVAFRNIWLRELAPAGATRTAEAWRPLFNGKDLDGWEMFLAAPDPAWDVPGLRRDASGKYLEPIGKNGDPLHVFTVEQVDGAPAIHISGQGFGVITTRETFANFHLRLQMKWGERKWGYKINAPRDSGLLYLVHGEPGFDHGTWPRSVEFQIQEHDTGDLYALGTQITANARPEGKLWLYDPRGQPTVFVQKLPVGNRCVRLIDREKPNGEWNTLELICTGGDSIHIVNGEVVMRLHAAQRLDGSSPAPLTSGHLSLQTEGAEVYFREISIAQVAEVSRAAAR